VISLNFFFRERDRQTETEKRKKERKEGKKILKIIEFRGIQNCNWDTNPDCMNSMNQGPC
jgi:hypothetical protein